MKNNGKPRVSFSHFLEKFPEVDLPVTLNDELQHQFSKRNDPLPPLMIEQHLAPLDGKLPDEYTEYIACFRLRDTQDFHALVYWRAELMTYEYTLVTLTPKGELIAKRTLAGTFYDGEQLIQTVATIDEDGEIIIMSGQSDKNDQHYDPKSSTVTRLELFSEGQIEEII